MSVTYQQWLFTYYISVQFSQFELSDFLSEMVQFTDDELAMIAIILDEEKAS